LAVLVCAAAWISALCAPDLSDGVQVLALLAEPYGANTHLLKNQFELLGWEVTFAGIEESVRPCHGLCPILSGHTTVDDVTSAEAFDVLVVMPTPGTFTQKSDPVGDLRASEHAVGLVRAAYDAGSTLYTGCSGILLFGDAGLLAGADVLAHQMMMTECRNYGGNCITGSATVPPRIDGQLVTGTNQRIWPAEIAAAIARSLDAGPTFTPSLDLIAAVDVAPVVRTIEGQCAQCEVRSFGEGLSEVGRDLCPAADGLVVAGMRYSADRREDVLVTRFDAHGDIAWSKAIGGPGRDVGEGICPSPDGGFYIAGYTTSAGAGVEDVLVLKLSGSGELEWASTFGGEGYDAAFDLCPSTDGGVVVCGLTYSSGAAISDIYLVKVDAAGQAVWTKTYGGARIDRSAGIESLPDGGYVVAGGTSSSGAGNVDMYVLRLDSAGGEVWAKTYGRAAYDTASQAIPLRDGGFLVAGYGDLEGHELMALTVVRVDADGGQVWTSRLGAKRAYDYGLSAVELASGGFLVVGSTNGGSDAKANDIWIHVLDEAGKSTAEYLAGGGGTEWPGRACVAEDGTVFVTGYTTSFGQGAHDVLLLKLTID